ncbi:MULTISPECIES: bifunctional UDP-N-acetylmuramoyl-tripeptide:D-alanyl-D-alanine ligase/alanine racemase [unclassified Sphingobacterium]|uniref:bifunctional UDP-N-acetylmuramoyl-tripeptide:D-alanyl-D-alanine ligase/alanine racemase n=1 Tax=unclassified Sphingobacterium TaxID=2609468 RepID=UPI00260049A0|nr:MULTISPECIES: bifunctional UDP-N-acetylmuramoyl-tripeptide:D-alanyl-D-alanine ligase/alanine racemase [unclassified Sphingobacterium]
MYKISEIVQIFHPNRTFVTDPNSFVQHLFYDSRKIVQADNGIFFALQKNRDGHHYLKEAYAKGVRNFVLQVDEQQEVELSGANIVWVEDSLVAMQALVTFHRQKFHYPVIGITGSNGKTIVKEWLFQLMSPEYKIYRSPKSYNSQLGVALSLWGLSDEYNLAIIEAGISEKGEMTRLEQMIKPSIGLLTNIGVAHKTGFESKAEKIDEKLQLFTHVETMIFPYSYLENVQLPYRPRKFSWGLEEGLSLEVYSIKQMNDRFTKVTFYYMSRTFAVEVPFVDKGNVENAINCVAVMLRFGYESAVIAARIKNLQPVAMRLELKKGKNNSSIIDDSYSNDLDALQIALEFLNQQGQHPLKMLILSDISGVSIDDVKSLAKLKRLLSEYRLDQLILIGKVLRKVASQFDVPSISYVDTTAFLADIRSVSFENATVLLKGGREFHFERISRQLVAKSHDTVLEINLNALENNLNVYRQLLPKHVKLMTMVKAFSYGSGSFEIANLLQFNRVDYLTVAFADEGVDLRGAGITLPIVVMSPDESSFDSIVQYNLEPEIYSFRILFSFLNFLKGKQVTSFPIHIKIDTGMHRLGFMPDEVDQLITFLNTASILKVKSAFSHLASAGNEKDSEFTQRQIDLLNECTRRLQDGIGYSFLRHIAATSAIELWPNAYFDMVRLGIGLYGVDIERHDLPIREASILKTNVTQIKYLAATETVGYNRHGVLHRDSKIATIKIGYADGYDRRFGNGVGQMMVNGVLVPTIGDICMDMCMLDVTDVEVGEEDEVIVYPDIKSSAKAIGTIPYELLTSISQRVKRVYFYE